MLQLTTGRVFFETNIPLQEAMLDLNRRWHNIRDADEGATGRAHGMYLIILLA